MTAAIVAAASTVWARTIGRSRARAAISSGASAPEASPKIRGVPERAMASATTPATLVVMIYLASASNTGRMRSSALTRFASEFAYENRR